LEVAVIVLGLLLLLGSGAVAVSVFMSNTDALSADVFGTTVTSLTTGGLFLAGALTGVLFLLGLTLLLGGTSRSRARRTTVKHARTTKQHNAQLQEENAVLRAKLEGEPGHGSQGEDVYPDAPAGERSWSKRRSTRSS
jgi:hypothetical protein